MQKSSAEAKAESLLFLHPHIHSRFHFRAAFSRQRSRACPISDDDGLQMTGNQFAFAAFLAGRVVSMGATSSIRRPADILEHHADAVIAAKRAGERSGAGVLADDEPELQRRTSACFLPHPKRRDAQGFDGGSLRQAGVAVSMPT